MRAITFSFVDQSSSCGLEKFGEDTPTSPDVISYIIWYDIIDLCGVYSAPITEMQTMGALHRKRQKRYDESTLKALENKNVFNCRLKAAWGAHAEFYGKCYFFSIKILWGTPSPVGCALDSLGQYLARVKVSGRNTP